MGCPFDREKLTAYYDGECESAEGADVERHIASCSECLRELGEMKLTSASVKTLPRFAAPPSIMEAVQREIRPAPSTSPATGTPAPNFREASRPGSAQAPRGLQWIISVAAVALVAASVVVISNRQETAAPRLETPVAHEAPRNGPGRSGSREKTGGTTLLKDAPSMKPSAADSKLEQSTPPDSLESAGGKEKQGGSQAEAPLAPIAKPTHPAEKSDDPAKETVLSEEKRHAAADTDDEDRKKADKEADLQRARPTARGVPKAPAADKAPAVEVLAISAKDMAQTRSGVEKLMEKLDRKIVVGSATLGDQAYVKDHYVEVELSEAEYQALVRDLQVQKAAYEKTDSEVEAKRLKEQLAKGFTRGMTEEAGAPADPAPAAAPERDQKAGKKGEKEEGARPDAPAAPGAKAPGQSPPPEGENGSGGGAERKTDSTKRVEPVRRKVIIAFREPVPAAKK